MINEIMKYVETIFKVKAVISSTTLSFNACNKLYFAYQVKYQKWEKNIREAVNNLQQNILLTQLNNYKK